MYNLLATKKALIFAVPARGSDLKIINISWNNTDQPTGNETKYDDKPLPTTFLQPPWLQSRYRSTVEKSKIYINGRKYFRCEICSRIYSLSTSLYNHLQHCGKPRRFLCHLCPYTAKLKQHLQQHLKRRHKLVRKSSFDETLVPIKEDPDKKQREENKDLPRYLCSKCFFVSHSLDELSEHEKNCTQTSAPIIRRSKRERKCKVDSYFDLEF